MDTARNHTLIQTKLAELGQANSQVKFFKSDAPADWNFSAQAASIIDTDSGGSAGNQ